MINNDPPVIKEMYDALYQGFGGIHQFIIHSKTRDRRGSKAISHKRLAVFIRGIEFCVKMNDANGGLLSRCE